MAEIIILANSRKLAHRCIAGIDIATGKWIRPISTRSDEAITWAMRNINGKEPKLLDILNVPLSSVELDDASQPENRLIEKGKWTYIRRIVSKDIRKYQEQSGTLFYNTSDRVLWDDIMRISREGRRSLLLIETSNLRTYLTSSSRGRQQARATFTFDGVTYDLVITDYYTEQNVFKGRTFSSRNLLTISLAGKLSDTHPYCYKLVAGVIEP